MFKVILIFLSLIISSALQSEEELSADDLAQRLHVVTVCSRMHRNLDKLITSAKKWGMDVTILGMDKPYPGSGTKLTYIREYLNTLDESDLVLFVDAFDVIIIGDSKQIVDRFLSFKAPLVISADTHCYPSQYKTQYPESEGSWRYINTGTYMGYVSAIKKWLDDMKPLSDRCDQRQTQEHYFAKSENQKFFVMDTQCKLFLTLYRVKEEQVSIQKNAGRITCVPHETHPCVIHANGKSFFIWNKIYNALIAQLGS